MKKILLFLILFTISYSGFARTFYYSGAVSNVANVDAHVGSLHDVNQWGQNTDGSAGAGRPTNFTTSGDIFIITNLVTSSNLNGRVSILSPNNFILGTGVTLQVGITDGSQVRLNVSAPGQFGTLSGRINIEGSNFVTFNTGATYSGVTLNTLSSTSTANYNSNDAQTVLNANYGNLTVQNGGTKTFDTSNDTAIRGTLAINNACILVFPVLGASRIISSIGATSTNGTGKFIVRSQYWGEFLPSTTIYNFDVEYNATTYQEVQGGTYNRDLTISGARASDVNLVHTNTSNTNTITLNGTFNHTATYSGSFKLDPRTSTVIFN